MEFRAQALLFLVVVSGVSAQQEVTRCPPGSDYVRGPCFGDYWAGRVRSHPSQLDIARLAYHATEHMWYWNGEPTCVGWGPGSQQCDSSTMVCAGTDTYGYASQQLGAVAEMVDAGLSKHPDCPTADDGLVDIEEARACGVDQESAYQCGDNMDYVSEPRVPRDASKDADENLEGLSAAGDSRTTATSTTPTTTSEAVAREGAAVAALEVSPNVEHSTELMANELRGLCRNVNNLAFRSDTVPSGSGGGVTTYGPSNMNDGHQCQFYWPWGNSATVMYRWKRPVSMDHFVLMTDAACVSGTICSMTNSGRGVGSGTVQWYNGFSWVTDGSFTNSGSRIHYKFRDCVTTTAVRIINMATHNCGQQLNPVIYEWSICECEKREELRLCGNATNLAPFARPSGSAGGQDVWGYGPSELNDGNACQWYWPTNTAQPTSPYIRYTWKTPVYVKRFALLTDAACAISTACSPYANMGRGVGTGTVAYRDTSGTWVVDGSFTSNTRVVEYELRHCVEITELEVRNIVTHSCGQNSNPVIYEWSACCCEPDDCCCH